MEGQLAGLINDIAALGSERLALVLDDSRPITAPPIHEMPL